jgi:spermidine synthase
VFQTDSPTLKSDALRKTLTGISSFFGAYDSYICSLPSFPEGICSFCVCAQEEKQLEAFVAERFASISQSCRYYNPNIHRGAFMLPEYIKRCMGY